MIDAFISYRHQDRSSARSIAEALAKHGLKVWWDVELLPGQKFADEINAVISQAKAVVVLWTPDSIKSPWVQAEASLAFKRGILVPVWLQKTELPAPFNTLHTLDLTGWTGSPSDPQLANLITGVRRLAGTPTASDTQKNDAEVNAALAQPAAEVEMWRSISSVQPQSIREYDLYLEKFGDDGAFAEIAKIRIEALKELKKGAGSLSVVNLIGIAGGLVAIAVGLFQLRDFISPPRGDTKSGTMDTNTSGNPTNLSSISPSGANSTPVARRDDVRTDRLTPIKGNLIGSDFGGADYDPDGDQISVYSVDGSTANVGRKIKLPSEATIIVSSNGDFIYDPTPGFKFLDKPGSASADRVTYSLIDNRGAKSPEVLSMFMVSNVLTKAQP